MNTWKPAEAIELIIMARKPSDVFGSDSASPAGNRAGRRLHRVLIAAVHPDRAVAAGLDRVVAEQATATLNQLYDSWRSATVDAAGSGIGGPHVVGPHHIYPLIDRVWATTEVAAYSTDDPLVRVEVARRTGAGTQVLEFVQDALAAQHMDAFVPTLVETAVTDGHRWVAYRLPAGMRSLREVHGAYPGGLDGRDWAWMARRILMTLAAANRTHGGLSLDTVLIHPADHGVMLTGWGQAGRNREVDGAAVAEIFAAMLRDSERQQNSFAQASQRIAPSRQLREYDLLLRRLYGERRFRPFALPDQATAASARTR
jgi:hypothetical protein